MTILDTELYKFFYIGSVTLIALGIMLFLVKSAFDSFHRTGGKVSSVFDEFFMGLVLIAVYVILVQLPPSTAVNFLVKPIKWLWGMLLEVLRTIGFPI